MPFTIGGEWIPESVNTPQKKPVKVSKEKRRSSYVTLIQHLPFDDLKLKKICSILKRQIGCGGSVKENQIELQGDQVEAIQHFLKNTDLKSI